MHVALSKRLACRRPAGLAAAACARRCRGERRATQGRGRPPFPDAAATTGDRRPELDRPEGLVGRHREGRPSPRPGPGLRVRWMGYTRQGGQRPLRDRLREGAAPVAGRGRAAPARGQRGDQSRRPAGPPEQRAHGVSTSGRPTCSGGTGRSPSADLTEHGLASAAGLSHTDAAALLTLANYADGEPLVAVRRDRPVARGGGRAAGRSTRGSAAWCDGGGRRRRRRARLSAWELTAAGRRLVGDARSGRSSALAGPLAALSRGERRALVPLLEKLLAAATVDARASRVICRLCDAGACGRPTALPGDPGGPGDRVLAEHELGGGAQRRRVARRRAAS